MSETAPSPPSSRSGEPGGGSPTNISSSAKDNPLSLRGVVPFLIPPIYLAIVFALQSRDRLGPSNVAPWLDRIVYDDYDDACMALRGLNSLRGRTPSQSEHMPMLTADEFNRALDAPGELKPGYYLEYPHATLFLFRLGYLTAPDVASWDIPAAVYDGWHNNLVEHAPRDERERALWRQFRMAVRTYQILMVICLLGLMLLVRQGYEPGGRLAGPAWLFVLPAALYFSVMRFDVVPALLVAASLLSLGRRWWIASAVLLGAATMVKVYPLFLAPICWRYLSSERRTALCWASAYAATVAAILLAAAAMFGWSLTFLPYRIQLGRGLETGFTLYDYLLPTALAGSHYLARIFRLGIVLAAVVIACWRRPDDLASVLRRGCVVLIVFLAVQVFYSPQWLLWLLPLLAPLAGAQRPVLYLAIVLDAITYITFPLASGSDEILVDALLVYARAAVWAAILWVMLSGRTGRAGAPGGLAAREGAHSGAGLRS
jgi:hypothetical protein